MTSASASSHGVFRTRGPLGTRINAWRKRGLFNPYWTEAWWLRRSLESIAPEASGLMLDVGCAERPHADLFAGRVRRTVGLEYPPVAHNLIPEIWDQLHRLRGVVDVWGDGQRLPFRDGAFDTLIAIEVLEHVPAPARLLAEAARVLRPGGRLLLSVPFAQPLHQLPFDYQRLAPAALEAWLAHAGFELERLEPRGNFSAVCGSFLSQWLLRTLAARASLHDGSVALSRWRAPFVLPLCALVQALFHLAARASHDSSCPLGYAVVASRSSSRSSGSKTTSQS